MSVRHPSPSCNNKWLHSPAKLEIMWLAAGRRLFLCLACNITRTCTTRSITNFPMSPHIKTICECSKVSIKHPARPTLHCKWVTIIMMSRGWGRSRFKKLSRWQGLINRESCMPLAPSFSCTCSWVQPLPTWCKESEIKFTTVTKTWATSSPITSTTLSSWPCATSSCSSFCP